MLAELQWLRPLWLLALLPLALLLVAGFRQQRRSRWQTLLPAHLARRLFAPSSAPRTRRLAPLGLALAWMLTVVALAGPSLPLANQPSYTLPEGRVLLLDLSLSMRATDLAPDRLSRARFKALDLLQHWQQGETGLIGYAGDAFMVSPLTTDVANITNLIPHLSPEIMPLAGSNLLAGLQLADRMLRQAGYHSGQLVLFSDGISAEQRQQVLAYAADLPWRISVLAFGTPDGAPITLGNGELLKDPQGRIVLPRLELAPLAQLARQNGGRLVRVRPDNRDIDQLLDKPADPARAGKTASRVNARQDLGYWLILPLLPLALLLFRRQGGPLWIMLLLALPPSGQPNAMEWWRNADQQGARLFEQQRFADAAKQFHDPLWQGSAWYRAGNYQKALQAFSQVDSATGWYNRGNALASLQRYPEAIDAYQQALQRDPDLTDAKHNLEQVKRAAKQQPLSGQGGQQQDHHPGSQGQGGRQPNQQQDNQQQSSASAATQQQPGSAPLAGQQQEQSTPRQAPAASRPSPADASRGHPQSGQPEEAGTQAPPAARSSAAETTPDAKADHNPERSPQQSATAEPPDSVPDADASALQHWLRQLPDDPSLLLRNKLRLQHQRRQQPPPQMEEPW